MFQKIICGFLLFMLCCSLNGPCIEWQGNTRNDDAIIANLETLDIVRNVKEKERDVFYTAKRCFEYGLYCCTYAICIWCWVG